MNDDTNNELPPRPPLETRLGDAPARMQAKAILSAIYEASPVLHDAIARECLATTSRLGLDFGGWRIAQHDVPIVNDDGRVSSLHKLDIEQAWQVVSSHMNHAGFDDRVFAEAVEARDEYLARMDSGEIEPMRREAVAVG